jgi:hypothetical protein
MKKSELQKEAEKLPESQLIKIGITSIGNLNTQTKVELDKNSGELKLITKVSFEAEIQPEAISELLKLQKKGIVINADFMSPQYPLPEETK